MLLLLLLIKLKQTKNEERIRAVFYRCMLVPFDRCQWVLVPVNILAWCCLFSNFLYSLVGQVRYLDRECGM